jgi:hypothetical protein
MAAKQYILVKDGVAINAVIAEETFQLYEIEGGDWIEYAGPFYAGGVWDGAQVVNPDPPPDVIPPASRVT